MTLIQIGSSHLARTKKKIYFDFTVNRAFIHNLIIFWNSGIMLTLLKQITEVFFDCIFLAQLNRIWEAFLRLVIRIVPSTILLYL